MYRLRTSDPRFLPHLGCDVEVELSAGNSVVLIGENGIGKSTLLKSFYQQYKSDHRLILAEQKPLDIFFDRTLFKFKKILFEHTFGQSSAFFQKFWDLSGFGSKEMRLVSQLSGGESQLLKLISVCSAEADIYLLDEPGQYLDREKKKLLNEILEELKKKGKSLLIVEHDWSWISPGATIKELQVEENILKERKSWII